MEKPFAQLVATCFFSVLTGKVDYINYDELWQDICADEAINEDKSNPIIY